MASEGCCLTLKALTGKDCFGSKVECTNCVNTLVVLFSFDIDTF